MFNISCALYYVSPRKKKKKRQEHSPRQESPESPEQSAVQDTKPNTTLSRFPVPNATIDTTPDAMLVIMKTACT